MPVKLAASSPYQRGWINATDRVDVAPSQFPEVGPFEDRRVGGNVAAAFQNIKDYL